MERNYFDLGIVVRFDNMKILIQKPKRIQSLRDFMFFQKCFLFLDENVRLSLKNIVAMREYSSFSFMGRKIFGREFSTNPGIIWREYSRESVKG